MKDKLNLLYIIDSLDIGGAERLLVNLVKYLTEYKLAQKIIIVTLKERDMTLKEELPNNVDVQHIPFTLSNLLVSTRKLKFFIKKNNVTHVHAHLFNSLMAARLSRVKGVKYYFTYHNLEYSPEDKFYSPIRIWLDRITLRKTDTCFYVSKQVQQVVQYSRKNSSKFEQVLYNFCSESFSRSYYYKDNNVLRLVAVGNLKAVKNHEYFINVFALIKELPVFLDIYGDGSEKESLLKKIAKMGIKNISLKGSTRIDSALLSNYDVFVMSSKREGMPVSLIEAMSTGLPSFLPDHLPVMREVAGSSAEYFSLANPSSFRNLLISVYKNKSVLLVKSEHATQLSKEFSIQSHVNILLGRYLGNSSL